jgi:hypothetical protein
MQAFPMLKVQADGYCDRNSQALCTISPANRKGSVVTPEVEAEIKAFVKERDEMLMSGDVDLCIAFHEKHNAGIRAFPNRQVAEISLHQARTAARSLPMGDRLESKKWLSERGYTSLDDGELQEPSQPPPQESDNG